MHPFIKTYDLDMYTVTEAHSPLPGFVRETFALEQGAPMYKSWADLIKSPTACALLRGQVVSGATAFPRTTEDVTAFKYERTALTPIVGEFSTQDVVKDTDMSILYSSKFTAIPPNETLDSLLRRLTEPASLAEHLMDFLFKTTFIRSMLLAKKFIIYALEYLKECATKTVDAYNAIPVHAHSPAMVRAGDFSTLFAIVSLPDNVKVAQLRQIVSSAKAHVSSGIRKEADEVRRIADHFSKNFDRIAKMFEYRYVCADFATIKRLWNAITSVLSSQDRLLMLTSVCDTVRESGFTPTATTAIEEGVAFLSSTLPSEIEIVLPNTKSSSSGFSQPPQQFCPPPQQQPFFVNDNEVPMDNDDEVPMNNGNNGNKVFMGGDDEVPMAAGGNDDEVPMNNGNNGDDEVPMSANDDEVPMGTINSAAGMPSSSSSSPPPPLPSPPATQQQQQQQQSVSHYSVSDDPACEVVASCDDSDSDDGGSYNVTGRARPQQQQQQQQQQPQFQPSGISREREAELLKRIKELEEENEKYKNVCRDYFELIKSLTSENN